MFITVVQSFCPSCILHLLSIFPVVFDICVFSPQFFWCTDRRFPADSKFSQISGGSRPAVCSCCTLSALLPVTIPIWQLLSMSPISRISLPDCHLANTFGRHSSVEEFYNEFNLVNSDYAQFSFTEMKNIFPLDGMDQWPKLLDPNDSLVCKLSLVSFMPSAKTNHEIEYTKVKELFQSVFVSKQDHLSVKQAMENMPTMALFLETSTKNSDRQTRQARKEKASTEMVTSLCCLAAVNYF